MSKRVYIVAEERLRARLTESLRGAGFTAEGFASAQALIVAVHRTQPDCVVAQWTEVGGTFESLRLGLVGAKPVPAIVLLDAQQIDIAAHVRRMGASATLTAPFLPTELLNQIQRLTGGRPRVGARLTVSVPTLLTAGSLQTRGVTTDISPTGLGVTVDRYLASGTEVTVSLVGRARSLELPGAVVSEKRVENRWQLGIQLAALTDSERAALREMAQSLNFTASQLRIDTEDDVLPADAVEPIDPAE